MTRWRFGALVAVAVVGGAGWLVGASAAPAAPACTVVGSPGHDVLRGTLGPDVLCGMDGDDTLIGNGGDDVLIGGDGNDTMRPGAGEDRAVGGPGSDEVAYLDLPSAAHVRVDLGAQTVHGGGADQLSSVESATGTPYADVLKGDPGQNILTGLGGADRVTGGGGDDVIFGRHGADVLRAGDGDNTVYGGSGDDLLVAGVGADVLHGGTDAGAPGDDCRAGAGSNLVLECEVIDNPADLTVDPGSHDFGLAATGATTAAETFTVSNTGGAFTGPIAIVHGDPVEFPLSNDACTGVSLAPGASCTVDFAFAPSATGLLASDPQFSSVHGGDASTSLSGTGGDPASLEISPASHQFQDTIVGSNDAAKTFTVTNTGSVPTGTIATSVTGTDAAHFAKFTDTCNGQVLSAGSSCTVAAHFEPTSSGPKTAALEATASPGGTASASLSGTGQNPAMLTISPTPTKAFGNVWTGAFTAQVFTVTNIGDLPTGLLNLNLSTTHGGFVLDTGASTCTSNLPAGSSCTFPIRFDPPNAEFYDGRITVSASPGGSVSTDLTGTGVATPANLEIGISPSQANPPAVWGSSASVSLGTTPPGMGHGVSAVIWIRNTGEADAHISNSPVPINRTNALVELFPGANTCGVNGPAATPQSQLTFSDLVIEGGTSCNFPLRLIPEATGPVAASFTISGSPGGNVTASLTMTGS